ncbi:MAG: RnfABCDGE type electron transport complex subunit D [Candidatus Omnitrophota bacterium]
MLKLESIKTQLILYLIGFAFFLSLKDKDPVFLSGVFIAVVSSLTVESVILYLRTKVFQVTESSIITGLIIGYVLASDQAWWRFIAASFLAILSKHVIRFRKKHIFNPASCGIFLTLIVFGASTQWKGTYLWYMLLPFGFYFARRIRKTEVIIGYAVVSLLLFGTQAFYQKVPLGNIFGLLSYFYIFVMIIEPMTSPVKPIGKYLFGAGLAGLIFVLTEFGARFDVELFSLLAMNAVVPLLNKLSLTKGGRV